LSTHLTTAARDRFFFDEAVVKRAFKAPTWRGCVLNRDKYTNARLPEILWLALVEACCISTVTVCGYYSNGERCAAVSAEWSSYSGYMCDQANYSPEYVIFDESGNWSILADIDVTTIGLEPTFADLVDSLLDANKSSLLDLTRGDFSDQDILSVSGAYIRDVLKTERLSGKLNGG
jgi:hypothetical protein